MITFSIKATWLVASLFLVFAHADAQVIDRMMAVVNKHVITLSDVNRERAIREALGDKGPTDDKAIVNDLIDAQIIQDEIAQLATIEVSEGDIDHEITRIKDRHGVPLPALRDAVRRRLLAEQFFDIRFREPIRVTDDETRQYYENVFVPEAQKAGVTPIPPLEQVSDKIQKNIIEEKTSHELDSWLATMRQRSEVEIFP